MHKALQSARSRMLRGGRTFVEYGLLTKGELQLIGQALEDRLVAPKLSHYVSNDTALTVPVDTLQ